MGLKDFCGKIVLLYFGYTTCPDICPATLSHLKLLMQRLETQQDRVQVLFISIDPERDTLERLNDYLPFFHPSFLGLRGSELETMETARIYRVKYFREYTDSSAGYSMAHTKGSSCLIISGVTADATRPVGLSKTWFRMSGFCSLRQNDPEFDGFCWLQIGF